MHTCVLYRDVGLEERETYVDSNINNELTFGEILYSDFRLWRLHVKRMHRIRFVNISLFEYIVGFYSRRHIYPRGNF